MLVLLCQIKQYNKHGKALRTATTINDTYDFAIGRRMPGAWSSPARGPTRKPCGRR